MKIIVKLNASVTPQGGMLVWFNQVPAKRQVITLETPNGVPTELLFAAECKRTGCDCARHFGNN